MNFLHQSLRHFQVLWRSIFALILSATCMADLHPRVMANNTNLPLRKPLDTRRPHSLLPQAQPQLDQQINFPVIPARVVTATYVLLNATASSGLPVTYTSNSPAVCVPFNASYARLLQAGDCSLTAYQPGNDTYAAATPVTQSFVVSKAAQVIQFNILLDATLGDYVYPFAHSNANLTVTLDSATPFTCVMTGTRALLLHAGMCAVVATQPGNERYEPAQPVTLTFKILKRAQFITLDTFTNFTVTMGTQPLPLYAFASSGLTVTFRSLAPKICNITEITVTLNATGVCPILAEQPGNEDYFAATSVTLTLSVLSGTQRILFSNIGLQNLSAKSVVLSATASSSLTVTFASNTSAICVVNENIALFLKVGICSVTAFQAGDENYLPALPITQTFEITSRVFLPSLRLRWDVYPTSRDETVAYFNQHYVMAAEPNFDWTGNVDTCQPGSTSAELKAAIARRINYFRAMAGIPARITINAEYSRKAQAAALMMSANGKLSHSPPTDWLCYSAEGAQGAGSSDLYLGVSGVPSIDGYILDPGDNNGAVGHRRWILYPPTRQMGTGDIPPSPNHPRANALWVFDTFETRSNLTPVRDGFVAWPPPGYVPNTVVYARWSFSHPSANFISATVRMSRDAQTIPLNLENISNGFGYNTLVWRPYNLQSWEDWPVPNGAADTRYSVTIDNVLIEGEMRSFSYDVIVIVLGNPDPQRHKEFKHLAPEPQTPGAALTADLPSDITPTLFPKQHQVQKIAQPTH